MKNRYAFVALALAMAAASTAPALADPHGIGGPAHRNRADTPAVKAGLAHAVPLPVPAS